MSLETEQALLGGLMVHSSMMGELSLEPDDFLHPDHALIFRTMRQLHVNGSGADVVTIGEKLAEEVSFSYLTELAENSPYNPANLPTYGEIIAKEGRKRRIRFAASEAITAIDHDGEPDQVISDFINAVDDTTEDKAHRVGDPVDIVLQVGKERAEKARGDGVPGIPSHVPSLNHMTGGAMEPDTWCIAGRPSVGKTAIGLGWCREAVRRGYKAAYFSLEMPRDSLLFRLCAQAYNLDLHKMMMGNDDTLKELAQAREDRPIDYNLWIDDNTYSVEQIIMRISSLKRQHGIDIAVLDHLGLVEPPNGSAKKNTADQVGDVTRLMHKAAKQNDIPILMLHQLNREIEKEDRAPRMSDLRDSGKVEQDMDVICFLHTERKWKYEATKPIQIGVGKQRNGPVGWINQEIKFYGDVQQHREISYG